MRKFGHVTPATPSRSMVLTQGGSVLYLCTKYEADSTFRSKVIRGGPKLSKLGHVT